MPSIAFSKKHIPGKAIPLPIQIKSNPNSIDVFCPFPLVPVLKEAANSQPAQKAKKLFSPPAIKAVTLCVEKLPALVKTNEKR
jgi:hypothetical protein